MPVVNNSKPRPNPLSNPGAGVRGGRVPSGGWGARGDSPPFAQGPKTGPNPMSNPPVRNWAEVQPGDTWQSIADRTGIKVQELRNRNRWLTGSEMMNLRQLRDGGRIRLTDRPELTRNRHMVRGDQMTWENLARRFNIPVEELLELNGVRVRDDGGYRRRIDQGTRVQLRPRSGGAGPVQNSLDPWMQLQFETMRGDAQDAYDDAIIGLDEAVGMGGLMHTRTINDLTRTYDDTRRGVTPAMARRGLLDSGVRVQAVQDMADAFSRQTGRVESDYAIQQEQWAAQRAMLDTRLREAMALITQREQEARTQAAQSNIGAG